MEHATVEPAEPQGSSTPGPDTSPSGDNGQASPESFGTTYRQHVERQAARRDGRPEGSSAGREPGSPDEQPAASSPTGSRPGAAGDDVETAAGADPSTRLTRAQRKALHTGQPGSQLSTESADTAGVQAAAPPGQQQAEPSVADRLSRLEGLLASQTPAEANPALDAESAQYRQLFGDDAEFARRANLAVRPSSETPLSYQEADELEAWARNREVDQFSGRRINRAYQEQFSAAILAAADAFGIDRAALQAPGTTLRDVFGAFVSKGTTDQGARIAQLEAANRLLADENEALAARLPAGARSLLAGGAGAATRAAQLADRTRMSGRQLMGAGLAAQQNGRRARPGAR